MAPMKAMKTRSSTPKAAKAPIIKRCNLIAKGLKSGSSLVKSVRTMLADTLMDSVGVKKPDRHSYQESISVMVKQALEAIGSATEKEVADGQAKIDAADAAKASLTTAHEAAKAVLDANSEALATAKTALKDAEAAKKAAHASEHDAEEEKEECDKKNIDLSSKKGKLDAFESVWGSLKDGSATDLRLALISLRAVEKVVAVEQTMLDSLPGAIKKAPSARGSFDEFVIKTFEEEMKKSSAALTAGVAEGEKQTLALVEKVAAAKVAATVADAMVVSCIAAQGEAETAKKTAQNTLKAAGKAEDTHNHEMKEVHVSHKKATETLAKFTSGPVKAYKELEALDDETPGFVFEHIEGLECDSAIVSICRKASVTGNGTISAETASAFLKTINDAGTLSKTAMWTIRYCLTEFTWAEAAHDLVVEINKSIPREPEKKKSKTKGYYITLDGVKCDSRMIELCNSSVVGAGDGRVSVEDAKGVFAAIADGGKQTGCEKWTLRYCLMEYKWTAAAKSWIGEELAKLSSA